MIDYVWKKKSFCLKMYNQMIKILLQLCSSNSDNIGVRNVEYNEIIIHTTQQHEKTQTNKLATSTLRKLTHAINRDFIALKIEIFQLKKMIFFLFLLIT